jgi:hypothetical protein
MLKGLGHEMNNFFKAYKIEAVLYVHAALILKFLGWLVEEKNTVNRKIFLAVSKAAS